MEREMALSDQLAEMRLNVFQPYDVADGHFFRARERVR